MSDDLHIQNAARIFGVPESEVTPEQRAHAKQVTFHMRHAPTGLGTPPSADAIMSDINSALAEHDHGAAHPIVVWDSLAADLWPELQTIVVLYRQPDVMSLWGIPYRMRDDVGQQPADLDRVGRRDGWLWLGTPGWWGSMSRDRQRAAQAFLEAHRDRVPVYPNEWCYLI